MILGLIDEAVAAGAHRGAASETLDIDPRTVQRWKAQSIGDDRRAGSRTPPRNKLSEAERRNIVRIVNEPEYRDLSVTQIVPRLADQGEYVASESTMYRVLHDEQQATHRAASKPPTKARPRELVAEGPNEAWSWDITYLLSPIRGCFYYLYMVLDVWSRKIVAAEVYDSESAEIASRLILQACRQQGVERDHLALHSDNGAPMKGATMLATLQALGIATSFSRPRVSDDNPYSEALFRTVKYRPEYPSRPFESLEEARRWVAWFVEWYNTSHRHSGINFVTPDQRHSDEDVQILAGRHTLYQQARARHPERWSGKTRDWSRVEIVRLNPERHQAASGAA